MGALELYMPFAVEHPATVAVLFGVGVVIGVALERLKA